LVSECGYTVFGRRLESGLGLIESSMYMQRL
jgi:hypothetical protein